MSKDNIKIFHRSENEIVVFKPAGIATQLSNDIKGSSLENILKKQLGMSKLFFPHRLDRITSGLLLIALNKEAVRYYNKQIRTNNFEKYYMALVENNFGDIKSLIGKHKRYLKIKGKMNTVVKSGGKPSFLEIITIKPHKKNEYKVFIKLITGRMHQIRIMLADMNIPLVDDFLYNKKVGTNDRLKNEFYLESTILKFNDMDKNSQTIYSLPELSEYLH